MVREGLAAVLRVRADLDLQSALPGGAATSALTALSLVRSSPSGQSSRALVRTLATVVTVACTTGDVELARRCAPKRWLPLKPLWVQRIPILPPPGRA